MNLAEKLLNAFFVTQQLPVTISDACFETDMHGLVTGVRFNADVKYDAFIKFSKSYCDPWDDIPFGDNAIFDDGLSAGESMNLYLADVFKRRNRSFSIDHIRFPLIIHTHEKHVTPDNYSVFDCDYNKQRLQHLLHDYCSLSKCPIVGNVLNDYFAHVENCLCEFIADSVSLVVAVQNKINAVQNERLVKSFKYCDWDGGYDVDIFIRGLNSVVIESMIAPDSGMTDLKGSQCCLKNAKRFLLGHARIHHVYVKYMSLMGEYCSDTRSCVMSDIELYEPDSLKTYYKAFFKELRAQCAYDRKCLNAEVKHARQYDY